MGDDAKNALRNSIGLGERNSLFAGVRAIGNWASGEQAPEIEAFVQANAVVGENINLYAEAAAGLDDWQATAGLRWGW